MSKIIPVGEPGWDTQENLDARLADAEERRAVIEAEKKQHMEECAVGKHAWEDQNGCGYEEIRLGDEVTCRWCQRVGTVVVEIHGRP